VDPTLEGRRVEKDAGVEPSNRVGADRCDRLRGGAESDREHRPVVDGGDVDSIDHDAVVGWGRGEQPRPEDVTEPVGEERGDLVATERHQVVVVVERVAVAGAVGAGGRRIEGPPVDTTPGTPRTAEVHAIG
jgi:hypothetical protein